MLARLLRRGRAAPAPEPDDAPPSGRFAVLATALARRRLDVVAGAEYAHTDGNTVHVKTDGATARTPVIVHALLVGHGSLAKPILSELRGNTRITSRFLLVEINRLCAPDGPWSPLRGLIDVPDRVPQTADPQESLRLACSSDPLPNTPAEWGEIRPAMLLRRIDDGLDLDLAPAAAAKKLRSQEEMDEVDEDESEDSGSILKALSSPLGSNSLSRMLQKLLGMGRSSKPGSSDGEPRGTRPRRRVARGQAAPGVPRGS